MDKQSAFRFSSAHGEAMNFARLGFNLDWRRIVRRSRRLFEIHLEQAAIASRGELVSAGFEWRRHFREISLFEEIRLQSKRKGRNLKREARARGQRLPGAVVFACTPEGQHMQRVLDDLDRRISEREAALLCG